jgi:hypothetical protein
LHACILPRSIPTMSPELWKVQGNTLKQWNEKCNSRSLRKPWTFLRGSGKSLSRLRFAGER